MTFHTAAWIISTWVGAETTETSIATFPWVEARYDESHSIHHTLRSRPKSSAQHRRCKSCWTPHVDTRHARQQLF